MQINSINLYSVRSGQTNKKYASNAIKFGNREEDVDYLVAKYSKSFEKLVYDNRISKPNQKAGIDNLFNKLAQASNDVKTKFLLDINLNMGDVFTVALMNSSYASWKVWEFVKNNTNKDIQGQFIIGSTGTANDTAFYNAATMKEPGLAVDILDFISKKTDLRLRRKFFNLNDSGKTQYDYLLDKGILDIADKFQMVGKYYKDVAGIKNKRNAQTQNNSTSGSNAASAKVGNSSNYRVYKEVKTKFSDVGGMFNVKNQIKNELLAILKNPKVKNQDKPSGVILFGSPGTGKTLLATAIAGEAGVPFISTEGSSFTEVYVGSGALNVRKLYGEARTLAAQHPSKTAIVFIDEIDAVGAIRGKSSSNETDNTLNALLSEMDGVNSKENSDIKIITIVATNRKDLLDSAFRKGRIDLEFHIDDPRYSEKARYEILKIHAKDKTFKNDETKEKILKELARTTAGFSGAELADVVKRAFRKTLYMGRENNYITMDDILNAKLESLVGIKNDVEFSEYEQAQTIAHEAGHAINLIVMDKVFENEQTLSKRPVRVLDLIVNDSYGSAAGMTFNKPSIHNQGRYTIESLLSSVVVTYGGYSVEEQLFGCHTDGVAGDLQANTEKIFNAITGCGLGSKTKYLYVKPDGQVFDFYKQDIKNDVETYSNTGMKIADKISSFAAPFIKEYSKNCIKNPVKVIQGDDFIKMFENWLEKSGKKDEYESLCDEIRQDAFLLRAQMGYKFV